MEHEGGEHPIKGRVEIWQFIRKALIELDRDCRSFRLSSASGERLRIGIESDDLDIVMELLDQRGQCTRATADIEDAMSAPDSRLIEECPPCRIAAQQLHERIVERQGPIAASSGKVGSLNIFRCFRILSMAFQAIDSITMSAPTPE